MRIRAPMPRAAKPLRLGPRDSRRWDYRNGANEDTHAGSVSKYAKAGGAAGPGTISSASSQGADAVRDGAVGPERFLRAGHYSLEVAAAAILAPVGI